MVTITINLENGNEASDACREVARLIENGYTNGMIGCYSDTFEIEGDIFSDEEEDDEFTPSESGKPKSELKPWIPIAIHLRTSETQFIHRTCALPSCSVKIIVL